MCGYGTTLMRSPPCPKPQFSQRIWYLTTLKDYQKKTYSFPPQMKTHRKSDPGSIRAVMYFKPSAKCLLISLLVTNCIQDKGTSARARFHNCPNAPPTQKYHGDKMLNRASLQLLLGISLGMMCVLIRNSINKDLTRFGAIHPLLRPILFQ